MIDPIGLEDSHEIAFGAKDASGRASKSECIAENKETYEGKENHHHVLGDDVLSALLSHLRCFD